MTKHLRRVDQPRAGEHGSHAGRLQRDRDDGLHAAGRSTSAPPPPPPTSSSASRARRPNVVVDNTTNNKTLNLSGQLNVWGNLTINPGTTVNVNPGTAQTLLQIGPTITNNGAIVTNTTNTGTVNLAGSLQALGGGYAQTYTGTGTFGSPGVRLGTLSVQNAAGVTIDPGVSALNVNRVNAFYGAIGNSDKISVGAGDATVLVIQRGATGIAFAAGSFSQTPTYNIGSGGLIEVYSQSQTPLTTGPEIPGTRTVLGMQIINPTGVTIAGGDITVDRNRDRLGRAPAQLGHAHHELFEPAAPDRRGGRRCLRRVRGQLRQRSAVPHAPGEPDRGEHLRVPGRQGLVQELRAHQHGDGRGRHGHDRGGSVRHRLRRDGRRRLRRPEPQPLLVGADHGRRGQLHEHDRPRDRAGHDLGERDRPVGDRRRHVRLDRRRRPATDDRPEHPDHHARLLRGRPRDRRSDDQRHLHGRRRRRLRHADRCSGCAEQPRPDRPGHLPADRSRPIRRETFPIAINPNAGNSATNTVTIKPAPGVSPAISGSSATALIVLNGIDYVTIDGSNSGGSSRDMTISNTNAGTSSAVIWGQTVTTADPTTNNTDQEPQPVRQREHDHVRGRRLRQHDDRDFDARHPERQQPRSEQQHHAGSVRRRLRRLGERGEELRHGRHRQHAGRRRDRGARAGRCLGRFRRRRAGDEQHRRQRHFERELGRLRHRSGDECDRRHGDHDAGRRERHRDRQLHRHGARDRHLLGGRDRAGDAELRHEPDREQLDLRRERQQHAERLRRRNRHRLGRDDVCDRHRSTSTRSR